MNKKSNTYDVFEVVVILFIVVIAGFAGYILLNGWNTAVHTNPALNSTQNMQFVDTYQAKWTKGIDYGTLIMMLLFPLVSFYFAKKIPTDPIWIGLTILSSFVIFILLMVFSNILGGFMDNATFAAFMSGMSFIPFIIPNLPYYGLIYVIIVMIGLFSKTSDTTQ